MLVKKENARSKKPTVIDVAKRAGVSKSSVSLVIRNAKGVAEATRVRVREAMDEIGYVYNREAAGLRSKTSTLVAIIANDLANPYLAQVIIALEARLDELGLTPIIVNINESLSRQQSIVASLKEYNVCGYLIVPAPDTSAEWMQSLASNGSAIVTMMRQIDGGGAPTVMPDNRQGCYMATKHLLALGHRRIAFVGGVESISDYRERRQGFIDAMAEENVPIQDGDILPGSTKRLGGKEFTHQLLDKDDSITAMVCFTDVVAYGVYGALRERNLLPGQDIAVVGFDDLDDSRLLAPSLTTVRVSAESLAHEACRLLGIILESDGEAFQSNHKVLIGVELVVRDSTPALNDI
ncbi:LacI family DNA-binding transcriptional regulator [Grimontia sp. SpTr1]|uniref:LacI family DNA-binding transcriptional regulator n=1 Tax=Grimontia sp. SpTr1 TaxID=2995319 RepID=UPI00248CB3C4|nr:LacI family DNA-binding transcriptional regulator [Grimontia sp. SpTr1]